MSHGRLNIGIRSDDACPVRDCWMADLVIKTIAGNYLPGLYPHVLAELKDRYPHLDVRATPLHPGADGIAFGGEQAGYGPAADQKKMDPVITIDLPPGWYIVWARVSRTVPEETKRVPVSVAGGCEEYVSLVLSTHKTAAKTSLLPSALSQPVTTGARELPDERDRLHLNTPNPVTGNVR